MDLKNKIIGYCWVAGDLFHYGHLHFLRECKKHVDFLIVGVLLDDVIESYKREPIIPFEERIEILGAIREVDLVVPQSTYDTVPTMKKLVDDGYNIKVLLHGDDWDRIPGKTWIEKRGGQVIQPKYYKDQNTTKIIKKIRGKKKWKKIDI